MSSDLERLVGRATIDPDFRKELIADPDGAIKSSGLSLTDDEIDRVKAALSSSAKGASNEIDRVVVGIW